MVKTLEILGKVTASKSFNSFLAAIENGQEIRIYDFVAARHGAQNGHQPKTVLAQVKELYYEAQNERRMAECEVLGALDDSGRLLRSWEPVAPDTLLERPSSEAIRNLLASRKKDLSFRPLAIGTLLADDNVPVVLNGHEIVAKHVMVQGMTGSGKSYACAVIVEQLIETGYPVLILDMHGDYLKVPEWAQTKNYHLDLIKGKPMLCGLLKEEFLELIRALADEPIDAAPESVYAQFYDSEIAPKKMGDFPKDFSLAIGPYLPLTKDGRPDLRTSVPVERQARKISEYWRQLGDMAPLDINSLLEHFSFQRGMVLDLGSLPAKGYLAMAGVILSRLFDQRRKRHSAPVFIVLEEAHNFTVESGMALERLRKVAREGRKFGIGLCLISQGDIDAAVQSQCNTHVMCRSKRKTQSEYFSEHEASQIASLGNGEAFVAGSALPFNLLVKISGRQSKEGLKTPDWFKLVEELYPGNDKIIAKQK